MNKLWSLTAFTFLLLSSAFTYSQTTPRWEILRSDKGQPLKLGQTVIEIDRANTKGWSERKAHIYYRTKYPEAVKEPNTGKLIDESRYEINLNCGKENDNRIIERIWYYQGNPIHKFTYEGEASRYSVLFDKNPVGAIIYSVVCPFLEEDEEE